MFGLFVYEVSCGLIAAFSMAPYTMVLKSEVMELKSEHLKLLLSFRAAAAIVIGDVACGPFCSCFFAFVNKTREWWKPNKLIFQPKGASLFKNYFGQLPLDPKDFKSTLTFVAISFGSCQALHYMRQRPSGG